jgi:HlyD family secretion protein
VKGGVVVRLIFVAAACVAIAGLGFALSKEEQAPTFLTAPVERGTISNVIKATGSVETVLTVEVSSQLSGRIADVFVGFNDWVKAGQPIAQLDQETFVARVNEAAAALKVAVASSRMEEAALERANVAVANAESAKKLAEDQTTAAKARQEELERDLQRNAGLARVDSISNRELTQARAQRDIGVADLRASIEQINMRHEAIATAEAELRMAEANIDNARAVVEQKQAELEQARVDVDRTVIRAPMDGVIIKRDVNPGQTVAVTLDAKTLFTIANDLRQMELHAKVDEADVGLLKIGQAAFFSVDAFPDRTFSGRVLQIRKAPEVSQNVVTYTAIVSASNPELLLLPGMTADLRIIISDTGEVLKVPNQALRFRPNGQGSSEPLQPQSASAAEASSTVWTVGIDGRPVPLPVKLGARDDRSTQLIAGSLAEGQHLIVGIARSQTGSGLFGIRLGF